MPTVPCADGRTAGGGGGSFARVIDAVFSDSYVPPC